MVLYVGNKLSEHGFTPTSVETLGVKLSAIAGEVVAVSSKRNRVLRMLDIIISVYTLRKRNPVVLIDTYSTSAFWFAFAAAFMCRMFRLPYIPILRGGNLPSRIDGSRLSSDFIFKHSFRNVAVSGYLFHEFRKRNLEATVIHNYLNIGSYPFRHRNQIRPKLLWVRSFHSTYNPEMALRVLELLKDSYPDAELCMVGPDKDGSLERCRKLAVSKQLNVLFTGKLSKEEWIRLSEGYDIFLNTASIDNTPVSVMEAMALGLIVVTTNAGGTPHLVSAGEDALMVNTLDADGMAASVMRLLSDNFPAGQLSLSARKKAEQWDWSIIGPQWSELIESASRKKS